MIVQNVHREVAEVVKRGLQLAPHLDLRHDTDLIANVKQLSIPLGRRHRVDRATGTSRWRGDALGPKLGEQIHVTPGILKTLGSLAVIIDNPTRKANRTFNGQPVILEPLGVALLEPARWLERR